MKRIISIFFVGGAVFTLLYGNVGGSLTLVSVLIFLLMYFVQGGFTGLHAVAGFILDAGVPINWTFVIFGVPMILAAIALAGVTSSRID